MPATAALVATIYEQHHAPLERHAVRICRDAAQAEDLVQEAFARLIVEMDAGRAPDNIPAWLYRVVMNLHVSDARKRATGRRLADRLVNRDTAEPPDRVVLAREWHASVEGVLATVPTDARTALVLAAAGVSGERIATTIGRTPIATRALMCRTRTRLRHRLEDSTEGREAWLHPAA
jgi:RNA polymerase sigma-70 factor (ECF subfamily)